MQAPVPTLLLIRPQLASERFATLIENRLKDRVAICVSPLMVISATTETIDFGKATGLIFTSIYGVISAALTSQDRHGIAYCVGEATCHAALNLGWNAVVAGQNSESLIEGILARSPKGPLLHLRGYHSSGDIAERLSAAGLPTTDCVVYDQELVDFNEKAKDLLSGQDPVIVPLFSRRSAVQFVKQNRGKAPLYLVAISDAVAAEINEECLISAQPDAHAMAESIELLVNQVCRVEGDQTAQ